MSVFKNSGSRKNTFIRVISLVIVGLFTLSFLSSNVSALDEQFYGSNNILFFDADDVCGVGSTSTDSAAAITLDKSPGLEEIFQQLINHQFSSIQAAAIMGNMYAESGFNSDAHEGGNDIGYGLVQWSFGRRLNLESFAASKGVPASNVPMQIEFLSNEYNSTYKSRLSSTPFGTGADIAAATKAWMEVFEVPYMPDGDPDPAAINSKRIPAAIKVFEFYKSLAPTATVTKTATAGKCSGNGVVAGDISKTAIGLALETPACTVGENANPCTPLLTKDKARPTYQVAKETYDPAVNGIPDWTDCGGFVATVMISSGVDPNYVKVSVTAQLAYVKSHPDKYKIITGMTNTGDLVSGDILFVDDATNSHTTIYTGEATNPSADASLGQRVPSVRPVGSAQWMLGHNATIARVLK